MTDTLAPEDSSVGGLLVQEKMVFRPQKKSVLGMIYIFVTSNNGLMCI